MKYLIPCLLFLPVFLGAQCYGSFEFYGAAGFSDTPNSFTEGLVDHQPVFVTRFGFGASFHLGALTYLRTSVQFSTYGSRVLNEDLRWGIQHDGNGSSDPSLASTDIQVDGSDRHFYGEGLLAFRYQFKTWSNWQPFLEGGFAVGKYGTTYTKNTLSDGMGGTNVMYEANAIDNFRSIAVIGRVGVGSNFNFSERVGVYGMAVLQRHLRNVNVDRSAHIHPWQATLEVGVRVFVDPR